MSYGDPEYTIETLRLEAEQAEERRIAMLIDESCAWRDDPETQAALRADAAAALFEHTLWLETLVLDEDLALFEAVIAEAQFEEDPDLSNSVARARAAVEDSGFVFDDDRYNGSADPFGDED